MIEYSDLEFFERVGEGLTATVWRGRWKSEDKVVAVKKMEEMTNREVENVHCSGGFRGGKGGANAPPFGD